MKAALYVEPKVPRWWDRLVIALTVASISLLLVDMALTETSEAAFWVRWADAAVCSVLLVDFGYRFFKAERRWAFFKRNWLDLVGAIPLVGPLHALRVVRVVRILRVTRIAVLTLRLLRRLDVAMPSQALGYLGLVTLAVWLTAGLLFFGFEHETNPAVNDIGDALWWSMTTLSTVGYGDLYPITTGGRLVAFGTMIVGVGVLGTLAATIATAFIDLRDRDRRGLRSYQMDDHLLILGWNDKGVAAVADFQRDPRYRSTKIVVIADLPTAPVEGAAIRFVRGNPGKREVLERASAGAAAIAIALASDPKDPRADHETALIVLALREVNPTVKVSAELVHPDNREFLLRSGCTSVVDNHTIGATLLVRSAQDVGVAAVIEDLLSHGAGSELLRVPIDDEHIGGTFRDYCVAMLDHDRNVVGLCRGDAPLLNPPRDTRVEPDDHAFVVVRGDG